MNDIVIRPCCKADLPQVVLIEKSVYGEDSYNHYFFRQALDLYPGLLLIAINDHAEVMGYVLGAIAEDSTKSWILLLAIGEAFRRKGVARLLTNELLKALTITSATQVLLTVNPNNHSAVSLYRKFGFVEVGTEEDYYQPNDPRVVMSLMLN